MLLVETQWKHRQDQGIHRRSQRENPVFKAKSASGSAKPFLQKSINSFKVTLDIWVFWAKTLGKKAAGTAELCLMELCETLIERNAKHCSIESLSSIHNFTLHYLHSFYSLSLVSLYLYLLLPQN